MHKRIEREELELVNGIENEINIFNYQYYQNLNNHRTIVFNGDITDSIVERVYLPLKAFEEDDSCAPITLILHSSGGSVSDSFFLANYLEHYKKPLNIIVLGYAASMATVLLAAGAKNPNIIRYCFKESYALIHDGYVALGASEAGTAQDIMAFNQEIDDHIRDFIISHTNITEEQYTKKGRHQWFIFSKEMKELGLIDKIYGDDDVNEE